DASCRLPLRQAERLPYMSRTDQRRLPHMTRRPALALLAATMVAGCGINSVPTAEENAKARWADVQNQYQRRADLIPNLVATVKGYAKQESSVLVGVTEARAKATSIQVSGDDLKDPSKIQQFGAAQGQLSAALG